MDFNRRNFLKVATALAAKSGRTPREVAAGEVRSELMKRGVSL